MLHRSVSVCVYAKDLNILSLVCDDRIVMSKLKVMMTMMMSRMIEMKAQRQHSGLGTQKLSDEVQQFQ